MALKLQSFRFVVVNFQFIYPTGTKKEDQEKLDPEYLKISGIATTDGKENIISYIMDKFTEFGLSKNDLSSLLLSNSVISGNGILKLDNRYQYRLELDHYDIGKYFWHLNIDTSKK